MKKVLKTLGKVLVIVVYIIVVVILIGSIRCIYKAIRGD